MISVPWTLRTAEHVDVLMSNRTFETFTELRDRVMCDDGRLLLNGEALSEAVNEMHNFIELVHLLDAQVTDEEVQPPLPSQLPGRFYGADATATERASGEQIELEDLGPLKPGSAAHSVLVVYGDGKTRTSYQASMEACGDFHARRRESTRLLTRFFLEKCGTMPNPAPGGRDHVDAYRITHAGVQELQRLDLEGRST